MRQLMRRKAISNNPECKKVYLSGGEYAGEVTRFDLVCEIRSLLARRACACWGPSTTG